MAQLERFFFNFSSADNSFSRQKVMENLQQGHKKPWPTKNVFFFLSVVFEICLNSRLVKHQQNRKWRKDISIEPQTGVLILLHSIQTKEKVGCTHTLIFPCSLSLVTYLMFSTGSSHSQSVSPYIAQSGAPQHNSYQGPVMVLCSFSFLSLQ